MQSIASRSTRPVAARAHRAHARPVVVRVQSAAEAPSVTGKASLELHIDATTIAFPFNRAHATELDAQFSKLLQTFAAKAKAERPKRWEAMDYKLKSSASEGGVEQFEVYCNPNAYDTPFMAKVLLTLSHQGVKLATEAKLYSIKSDLDMFLQP